VTGLEASLHAYVQTVLPAIAGMVVVVGAAIVGLLAVKR
jgi:hypothetical protein